MPLRAKFLFAADLGDPISSISVSDVGCMAGTMLGKVWLYSFDTKQAIELTTFSDEGIRGLHLDDECACATVGGEGCRSWKRSPPHEAISSVNFRSLDKKNTQAVKHVLQHGPWVCVLFPTSSTMVHVTKQDHHHCQFKLFDYGSSMEVAPLDFDGKSIVVVDRTLGNPVYRFVNLEQSEPGTHVDVENLPLGKSVTLAKLWGPNCLAYVAGGSQVYLYDFRKKTPMHELAGHKAEIVAMDASGDKIIATLSSDAQVFLWNAASGKPLHSLRVPEASFFLGFPYCLTLEGNRLLISADEGVILMELDES